MKKLLAATALITAFATPALAYDKDSLVLGVGGVEVFDTTNNAVEANIEYRSQAFDPSNTLGIDGISWMAGVEVDTNESGYVYAGFLYDLPLTETISITPSVGAGFYKQGEGKDLGGSFEFRDTIEVNYKLTPDSRIGLALSHKSSAGIHDSNPGTESAQITYSMSLE